MATEFWFKFNFKDWASDVKPLSLTARGLLMEIIIYMNNSKTFFIDNDIRFLVRLSGGLTEEVTESITEFKKFGILDFDQNDAGEEIIVSRRLRKFLEKSRINTENGQKGGNPALKDRSRLTDSDNQTDNQTPNSNFNSDSDSNFQEKGVQGEKRELPEHLVADIPNKVNEFADRALQDLTLFDSARQRNKKITEKNFVEVVEQFRGRQIHGEDYYHRYQQFKTHLLNSPLLTKFEPITSQAKTKSGQALRTDLLAGIEYDEHGKMITK